MNMNKRCGLLTIAVGAALAMAQIGAAAESATTPPPVAASNAAPEVAGWPIATRDQAQAGNSTNVLMTPRLTAEAIDYRAPEFKPDRLWRTYHRLSSDRQGQLPPQIRCVIVGDSWSAWPANEMYGTFGILGLMGDHFPAFCWTNGATLKQGQFDHWMSGRIFVVPPGGELTFGLCSGTVPVLGSEIKVSYLKEQGGGTFKIQTERNLSGQWTDEPEYAAVNTDNGGARSSAVITIRKQASEYYRVKTTGVRGTAKILYVGVIEQAVAGSRGGVAELSLAEGGTTPPQWLTHDPALLGPVLRDWDPHLIFIRSAETLSDWQKYMDPLVKRLRDAAPRADFVVIGSHPTPHNRDPIFDNSGCDAFLKAYCASNDILFVDCRSFFPDFDTMVSIGYGRSNDVHLSYQGNDYLSGIVWQHLRPLWAPFTQSFKQFHPVSVPNGWLTDRVKGKWTSVFREGPSWSAAGDLQNSDGYLGLADSSGNVGGPADVAGFVVPRGTALNNAHALAVRTKQGVVAQFMPGGGFWVAGFGTAAPYSPARPPSGRMEVTAGNAREVPLVAAGASGQTANLFEARTGANTATSGVTVARIDGDGNLAALNIKRGKGAPEGVVTGAVGDLYLRLDGGAGTTLYVKETGAGSANGWVGK